MFFFLWNELEPHSQQRAAGSLELIPSMLLKNTYHFIATHSSWIAIRNCSNCSQIIDFFGPCDLEIWQMTLKNNRAPLQCHFKPSGFLHHFVAICEFKPEFQSGNSQFGLKASIFGPCDLEIWQMTSTDNRAPLLCRLKLIAWPSVN